MWKFLLGVLIGVVVTVIGIFIVFLALGRLFANKAPSVPGDAVLVMPLRGDVPEAAPMDINIPFFEQRNAPTIRDLWTALHQAVTDNRIKALVIEPQGLATGWARLEEIRQELVDFKRSGKPVYAYLQSPGSREYYLASVADRVYLSPADGVDVKGFALSTMYFKDGLDKLGVQFQVDHIGRYKDAGDVFTRQNMSPETREVLGQVIDQIYNDFCSTIGQNRHKSPDDIKALIDQGPFTADQAKANGLVDVLAYSDQLYGDLQKKTNVSKLNRLDIRTYFRAAPGQGDRIALLVGDGEITQGDNGNTFGDSTGIADRSFIRVVRQVRNDSGVKGVIVRINSPGGDALASDVILHELKMLSDAKPTIISMSDVAASGGYYMAMTGDPVVAYPDTITGSIGVLYMRPVMKGLIDKLGVNSDVLTRGKLADLDSPFVPLSDAAHQKLHDEILSTYKIFVSKVATARHKSYDQIDPIAQGRVWMGTQAQQNGLVDQLGGLNQAVALIRQKAHLTPTGQTNLVIYPPRKSLLEALANTTPDSLQDAAAESKLRKLLPALPSRVLLKGGLLKVMPYRFDVQ